MRKYCSSLCGFVALIALTFCFSQFSFGQAVVTRINSGTSGGYGGDGLPATSSSVNFNGIEGLAVDTAGNIFVYDAGNFRIRKIDHATGIVSTYVGNGIQGFAGDGGYAVSAKIGLKIPSMCVNKAGDLYLYDRYNYRIRKVDHSTHIITTVAGNGSYYYSGDGGPATDAGFSMDADYGLFVDTSNNIYFGTGSCVRKVTASTGTISLFAGNSGTSYGFTGVGGPATAANLGWVMDIVGSNDGNIYVANLPTYGGIVPSETRVVKIDTSGILTLIAGGGSQFPDGCQATNASFYSNTLAMDSSGNLILVDARSGGRRKIDLSSRTINSVYNPSHDRFGTYALQIQTCDNRGNLFVSDRSIIEKVTGASSVINTWLPKDTLLTASCSLPATYGFIVHATINGVPSATDSVTVTIEFADSMFSDPGTRRTYKLPYWFAGGTYGFGSASILDTFTYHFPRQYKPRILISSLNNYFDYYQLPTIMVGSTCATGYTTVGGSLTDSFVTSPCSIPTTVNFNARGHVYYPASGDSVYLLLDYGDGSRELHVVPYDSASPDEFQYSANHTYTAAGDYRVLMYFSNSAGNTQGGDVTYLGLSSSSVYDVHIGTCSGGRVVSHVTADHNSACHYPDTVMYHYWGQVYDSAILSHSIALNVNYGDGADIVYNLPITYQSYVPAYPPVYRGGGYTYNLWVQHIFSMPGVYTSYYHDTAGIYSCDSMINYGNTPSQLVVGSSCVPVHGMFYIDSNGSCTHNTGEVALAYWPYAIINQTAGDTTYGWCDESGRYSLNAIVGSTYKIVSDPTSSFAYYGTGGATLTPSCPSTGIYTFTATSSTSINHDFAFTCSVPDTVDMAISAWGWGFVPGDTGVISIWSSNDYGYMCDTLSSSVTLTLDSNLTYRGMLTGPAPTTIAGQTLTWHFASSGSLFDFSAFLKVTTDTTATIFDTIRNVLYIAPSRVTDGDLANNTYVMHEPVTSSWDPNEKEVSPKGFGPQGYIKNGTPLSYMVHFQNSGSAPARNVTVVDTISANLDISTLQVIGSSSAVQVYHLPGNVIKFRFNNIYLPDSATNPAQSVGYVSYNILPHHNLAPGTQIANTANIYFDYNPGVPTNTTINTIDDSIGTIAGPNRVCVGSTIIMTSHLAYGTWSLSNAHATVSAGGVITGVTVGVDTLTLHGADGVTTTKVIDIDAFPGPTVSGVVAVCEAANISLVPSDTTGGSWSVANAHASVVGGVVSGVTAGPDTVYYSVSNSCGTASTTHLVTVNPLAHAGSITGSVTTICSGDSTAYIDSVSGAVWTSSNPSIATVGMFGMVHGTGGGTAIISVTVTSICNTDIATKVVHVNPTPVAGTVYGASNLCVAATTYFGDTTGTSGGAWYSSNTSVASVNAAGLVYGVSPGTAVIRYEIATATCGTAVASRSVTVNALPYAGSISGSSNVCVTAGITLTSSGASAGGSWSSSTPSIGTIGTTSGVVTGVSAGNTTITYSVSTALCGSAFTTTPITVNALPVAGTITGGTVVCEGVSIALSHVSGTTSGTWSSSDTASLRMGSTGTATGVSAGTATVTFTATTALCGSAYATLTMTIMPQPVPGTISGSATVCPGSHTTLADAASGGTWSASNSHATISGGVVSGVTPGLDTMYYTVTNSCGTRAASLPMTVATLPDAGAISGPAIVCLGTTITLTDAASGGAWSSSSSLATVSGGLVTGISTGSLIIYYSVTNVCGTATVTHNVDVLPNLTPSVSVTADPGFSVCTGDEITVTANGINGGSAPGYIWTLNGLTVAHISSFHYVPSAGDHINCQYISNLACRTADTVAIPAILTIAVNDPVEPTISITQSATAVSAIGQVVVFNAIITNGGTTPGYQWFVNGIAVSGATNAVFNYAVSGPSSVYCILASNAPCSLYPSVTSSSLGVWADNTGVVNTDTNNEEMSIFPNPNSGSFSVELPTHNSDVLISITDAAGKTVKTLNITNAHQLQIPMDMTNVAAGVYIVRVETDGRVWRKKIVVM